MICLLFLLSNYQPEYFFVRTFINQNASPKAQVDKSTLNTNTILDQNEVDASRTHS